ncbi:hypothetical protein ASG19_13835 [Rhizobium sp. Leaf306]|nr:hypothetical protein ASG19_13835 [Rhizobium sp. Leaf306]
MIQIAKKMSGKPSQVPRFGPGDLIFRSQAKSLWRTKTARRQIRRLATAQANCSWEILHWPPRKDLSFV